MTAAAPAVLAAQPTTTIVYPTGTFPQDVTNVQAAIDRGGIVRLKAVDRSGVATPFDFGPAVMGPGYVVIHHDVDIVGERTRRGSTTIRGGWDPVSGFSSARVSVRDIDFKGPLDGALLFIVPGTARTLITGDRISHVVGAYRTPDRTTAEAIVVSGGIVSIDDNIVTGVVADVGSGISEFGSSGPVEILRNRISGTSMHAIEASGPGSVRIAGNVLRPGTTEDDLPGFGIEVDGPGTFLIRDNDVLVESPTSIGIWAFGALGNGFGEVVDPVIAHNHVVLRPVGTVDGALYDDGIDLAGRVTGADVSANTIEGSGATAFSLFDLAFDPAAPSDLGSNRFRANRISGTETTFADVFLDDATHDTVFHGACRTVVDLGLDNHVACATHEGSDRGSAAPPQATARGVVLDRRLDGIHSPGLTNAIDWTIERRKGHDR